MSDLSFKIRNVTFANPVWTASGTFGYGDEYADVVDVNRLGAIVTKSLTLLPRQGAPPPRTCETAAGMLNAIGLQNVGLEGFLNDKLPMYETIGTRIIVSIAAYTIEEFCTIVEALSTADTIHGFELNISCPNTDQGGIFFGVSPDLSFQVVEAVRQLTDKIIIAKLTPNVSNVGEIAAAVEKAGADGVSLINTLIGMSIDVTTRRPRLGRIKGGLSGPCIKPVALAQVHDVYNAVTIPVIGMGGISSTTDVLEFMIAGATAVQIGTANFTDPMITMRTIDELHQYCADHGLESLKEMIGSLQYPDAECT